MKELSIEEKAKRYELALERCRKLYNEAKANEYNSDIEDYETIFPELAAESEDERIRRQTLKVLNYYKDEEKSEGRMPTEIDECIDWLEKQGEQKPAWSVEDQNALEDVREAVVNYWGGDTQDILLYWLKSIKDRVKSKNYWKPSDAQMSALKIATCCPDLGLSRVLKTLYNDLDKLMKE